MQQQMRACIGLILVFTALAGCLDGDADGTDSEPTPTGDATLPPSPTPTSPAAGCAGGCPPGFLEASLADCNSLFVRAYVEAGEVDPFVPDEYELSASPVTGLVDVLLRVVECRQAVVDNETALQSFRWASVGILVEVPESVSPDGVAQYMVEYFAENHTILERLGRQGYPTIEATIDAELALDQPSSFSIHANDAAWYEMTVLGAGADTIDVEAQYIHIHNLDDDQRLWYKQDYTLSQTRQTGGSLAATNGILANFATAGQLPVVGGLDEISNGRITTGLLPDETHT